jgi:hypothetical protein
MLYTMSALSALIVDEIKVWSRGYEGPARPSSEALFGPGLENHKIPISAYLESEEAGH